MIRDDAAKIGHYWFYGKTNSFIKTRIMEQTFTVKTIDFGKGLNSGIIDSKIIQIEKIKTARMGCKLVHGINDGIMFSTFKYSYYTLITTRIES